MKSYLRSLYKLLPSTIEKSIYKKYFKKEHQKHLQNNNVGASNYTKQQHLLSLANENNIKLMVETGTYLGDTIFMLQNNFTKIYSIELSEFYHNKAKKRFNNSRIINLLHGDSGQVLQKLITQINEPCLFWLDGHYSGGKTALGKKQCPIFEELNHIFTSSQKHIIVVDDARLFIGKDDYPTIIELESFVKQSIQNYSFNIINDSIVIKIK